MSVAPAPDPSSEQLVLQAPRVYPARKREAGLPSPRRRSGRGSRVSVGPGQQRAPISAAHPAPCRAQEPSVASIFPVTRTVKPSAGGALPGVGARGPWTHSSPLQDEESCVTQHAARGGCEGHWDPGEGQTGARVKEGVGGARRGGWGQSGWHWELGWSGPKDRRTVGFTWPWGDSRVSSTATGMDELAVSPLGVALVAAGAGLSGTLSPFQPFLVTVPSLQTGT